MVTELQQRYKELIETNYILSTKISPDGSRVAYTVNKPNWRTNEFAQQLILLNAAEPEPNVVLRSCKVNKFEWIDSDRILVLSSVPDGSEITKKPQLYMYYFHGEESLQLTAEKFGINNFKVYNDYLLLIGKDEKLAEMKDRKNIIGDMTHDEKEEPVDTLYLTKISDLEEYAKDKIFNLEDEITNPIANLVDYIPRKTIENAELTKNCIVFGTRPYADLVYLGQNKIYQLNIDFEKLLNKTKEIQREEKEKDQNKDKADLINHELKELDFPDFCDLIDISPDRDMILLSHGKEEAFYEIRDLYTYKLGEEDSWELYNKPERSLFNVSWTNQGIMANQLYHTTSRLVRIDPEQVKVIDTRDLTVLGTDVSDEPKAVIRGASPTTSYELYIIDLETKQLEKLTDYTSKVKFDIPPPETIRWKSRDDYEIEGVMYKPRNFDPNKKYPLLFIIHGGPGWLDMEVMFNYSDIGTYPLPLFLEREIIIVKPNYRGSIGRGREFKRLNVGNIGIGDQWDLESCIEYLDDKGYIDVENIGCCGWSQGGFISAFMGTHSDKIKAVSMGAGISSWYTYWKSNDIRQWTKYYLEGNPHENWEEYIKTAPISKIGETGTPFLIQHGENDQRVPLTNALEMKRRLEDHEIQVELFVYNGMGHGISKPRPKLAVMHQNYTWFCHHLLGDELDFFKILEEEDKDDSK